MASKINTITGHQSNDLLYATSANDAIDGGAGIDTVVYSRKMSDFKLTKQGTSWVVNGTAVGTGTDTLNNVEFIRFSDGTLNLATGKLIPAVLAPSLTATAVSGAEDSAIALKIASSFTNLSGAEQLLINISGVPANAKLSAGTLGQDGSWTLTTAQLQGLTITPPANSDADFALTVKATLTDPVTGTSATTTAVESITVNAVADAPTLTAQAATGTVDTAIALNVAAALTDTDGSESLAVTIAGVPTGAKLSAGTLNSDGSWALTQAQLTGLTLTPVAHSDADFTLTVTATATEAVGGATAVKVASLPVTVNAAPVAPTVPVFTTTGTTTTVTGTAGNDTLDLSKLATLTNSVDGGAGTDTVLLPFSQDWYHFTQDSSGHSIATEGHATGQVTTLTGVEYLKFVNNPGYIFDASGKLTSSSAPPPTTPPSTTPGATSAPTLTVLAASGNEDSAIALNVAAALTDTTIAESLGIVVSGVPTGARLSGGTLNSDGTWSLTPAQLAGLTITPSANSDADFTLTVTATATQTANGVSAVKVAALPVTVNAVADAPTLTAQAATGTVDTAIALNVAAALTDTDGSESLAVTIAGVPTGAKLSAGTLNSDGSWALTQAQLTGLTLTPVAHSDADFTLTVTATATEAVGGATAVKVASLPVTVNAAPVAPTVPVFTTTGTTTTVTGTAGNDTLDLSKLATLTNSVDGGAGTDTVLLPFSQDWYHFTQDSSGHSIATEGHATGQVTTLTGVEYLKFVNNPGYIFDASGKLTSSSAPPPTTPPSTTPGATSAPTLAVQAANGNEDSAIALNVAAALTDTTIAESLGIVVSGVPTGARLSGGTLNSDGTWSLTPAQLAGLTITPSANSDADFTLTVTATATQTANGVSAVKVAALPVTVNAVADAPTLTAQAATGTVDTAIALNVAAALTDTDGSESLAVTIAGVPTGAKLSAGTLNSDGSWALTQAQLAGLTLTPVAHSDADFTLTVTATATEAVGGATAVKVASLPVTVNAAPTDPAAPVFTTTGTTTTVTGTAGDDTLDLSKLATLTNSVDGGAGTDTVLLPFSQDWYHFTQDSSGHSIATEGHATGQVTTLTGVENLKFVNNPGYIFDASGKLTSSSAPPPTTPPSTTPGTTPPSTTPSGIVHEPNVMQATAANDVVGMKLQNNTATVEHGAIMTFGQVFAAGDVMKGDSLVAHINGHDYAVQMDVKALNADGSVRHAILSLQAPDLAAGAAVDVMLAKGGASTAPALQASDVLSHGYDLTMDINIHNADGSKTLHTIDGAAVLRQAIANGKVETWTSGSLASEFRVETDVATNLRAVLDIRVDANGHFTTDVIMANDGTFTAVGTVNYDVAIKEAGQVLFSDPDIAHHRNSTWHHEVSTATQPNLHVVYDVDYLNSSGAVPTVDTTIGINSATLDSEVAALAASNTGPMGNALVTTYIPTTGGRADIGPTTGWSAGYLVSQDERAEQVMLATADASGSAPWHFRDEATGDPLRLDLRPGFWIDERATAGYGPTTTFSNVLQDTGWEVDRAHMPALSYVSYLVTGEHYYLDEMQYEASWQLASISYRGVPETQPIRDIAWSLRDLGNVAYVTPDSDPLKGYFTTMVNEKLDELVKHYITDHSMQAAGEVEGWIRYEGNGTSTPPWQQDYMATSLGVLNSQGFSQAGVLLKWMDNFISGRFIHEADGYNPLNLTSYGLTVEDPVTKVLYSTWKQVYDATFPPGTAEPTQLDGYPDSAGGYAANAKAALASIISATGSVKAIEAYGFIASHTTTMADAYTGDPTWAITPKLADGTQLENTDLHVGDAGNNIMTGTDHNELLHGGAGNDTIHGGGGIDFLFGGDGDDLVFGDLGNDFLFGGAGNDTLNGGAGDNFLKGGAGGDTFVFDTAGAGHDTIADFSPTEDWLRIKQNLDGDGITTTDQVLSQATQNADGNVVLHLGAHHDVTLDGITKAMLLAHPTAITMIA